jgi:hypothetical protein
MSLRLFTGTVLYYFRQYQDKRHPACVDRVFGFEAPSVRIGDSLGDR